MMTCIHHSGYANIRKKSVKEAIRRGLMLMTALVVFQGGLFAQSYPKVKLFDINGLTLKMNLDHVIKLYNITNIKVNKDVYGIINGYEIKKRINQKKEMVILNFTGEKRLYRIHYTKIYDRYRYKSKELFSVLKKKYGRAWTDNMETENRRNKNIYACWGSSCKKYPRTTPILTAKIYHSNGRLQLMLADNRIFNRDWKRYKQKLSGQITDRDEPTLTTKEDDVFK